MREEAYRTGTRVLRMQVARVQRLRAEEASPPFLFFFLRQSRQVMERWELLVGGAGGLFRGKPKVNL